MLGNYLIYSFIKIGFLEIGIGDILDILLVGLLFFQLYKILRGTLAFNIFLGIVLLYWVWLAVRLFDMKMLSTILGQFVESGFILLVILFQPEIRRFLFYVGRGSGIGKDGFWAKILNRENRTATQKQLLRDQVVKAVTNMAKTQTGALIVFAGVSERNLLADTGVLINGEISGKLIESVFDKGSPLHDGAMVISDFKIWAAGCVLPVSENPDLPKRIGMRHRAAAGITEQVDVHVIIVSEETGRVSHAQKGKIDMGISPQQLVDIIDQVFGDL